VRVILRGGGSEAKGRPPNLTKQSTCAVCYREDSLFVSGALGGMFGREILMTQGDPRRLEVIAREEVSYFIVAIGG